jgi:NADH-quinone oxidoreductase subunit E
VLSDDERREIEAELRHYPQRRAAAVDALKIVQRRRGGWVSDEALADVAAFLGMTPDELDGIATFYSLIFRRPVGRHVVLLCDSVSCWMMGGDRVAAGLRAHGLEMGRTDEEGRFTLLPVPCLGACDHAPVLMVDDDMAGDLDEAALPPLLERYP